MANRHLVVDVPETELWVPPEATVLMILLESFVPFLPAAQTETWDTDVIFLSLTCHRPSSNLGASILKA